MCQFRQGNRQYPLLRWIMSLVVLRDFRRKAVASCLLRALMANLPEGVDIVKINNIDQFEMEYIFHD